MSLKNFLKSEVEQILKLMDDSADTGAAIREVLLAVYTNGIRYGVAEGYSVGYKDGKRASAESRHEDIASRVVGGIGVGPYGEPKR